MLAEKFIPLEGSTSGKNIYTCPICEKVSSSSSNMNQLELNLKIHSNETPYTCDICRKTFGKESNLLKYKVTHKNGDMSTVKCNDYD